MLFNILHLETPELLLRESKRVLIFPRKSGHNEELVLV